jgi:hypothetical protein
VVGCPKYKKGSDNSPVLPLIIASAFISKQYKLFFFNIISSVDKIPGVDLQFSSQYTSKYSGSPDSDFTANLFTLKLLFNTSHPVNVKSEDTNILSI